MTTLPCCCSCRDSSFPASCLPSPFHRPPRRNHCLPSPLRLQTTPAPSLPSAPKPLSLPSSTTPPILTNLTPKQQTLLLKSQPNWRATLLLFRRLSSLPGYSPNPIHYNIVLRSLGRAHQWDELRLCWLSMARNNLLPTNTTYASLIDVYAKAGLPAHALLWLKHMRSRSIFPDEVTMNTALRVLKDSGRFHAGEVFFEKWCAGELDLECLDIDSDGLESCTISPKLFLLTELFRSGARGLAPEKGGGRPQTPRRAATYNTLIDLYGKAGKLLHASKAFAEMLRSGVVPDTTTFNTMINVCGSHGHLDEAEALLAKMEERRVRPDTKTFNIFMSLYASLGNVEAVKMYYRKIILAGLSPDTVSIRIILQVLCTRGMVRDVENVIDEMLQLGLPVDEQSLPVVMKMYIDEGLLDEANAFFEKHCAGGGISSKNFAAIMDAYAEKGLWKEAEDVFCRKRYSEDRQEVQEYNVMVKAYGKAKLYDKALSLFESMRLCGTWPDECTYNSLIQMLCAANKPDRAKEILDMMKNAGFRPRCETFSALIGCYCSSGSMAVAVKTSEEMRKLDVQPNEVVYGQLIDAFVEQGEIEEALNYFRLMEESGVTVNQIVLTSLIKAYAKVGSWEVSQELYAKMKTLEDGPDVVASNCMINLYAGLGMVTEAKVIFDKLRENSQADGVSYSTMMYLLKSMGMLDEAIGVAQDMEHAGLLTDCASYNNVLALYAANSRLRACGELLYRMLMKKILPDLSTLKTIFTVLKKGGMPFEAISQLELSYNEGKPYARQIIITSLYSIVGLHAFALESCELFTSAERALESSAYNVAIRAYGAAGEVDKALNLYMRMQDDGMKPDLVTYINLACCYGRAGMVEGVKRIYSLLKYGEIESSESLFRALIDAYIDAGKKELAELVEQEMRFSIQSENLSDSESEDEV